MMVVKMVSINHWSGDPPAYQRATVEGLIPNALPFLPVYWLVTSASYGQPHYYVHRHWETRSMDSWREYCPGRR